MTIWELAEHDRASRRRVLEAALADELRGRSLALVRAGRLDGFDRNIARLEGLVVATD